MIDPVRLQSPLGDSPATAMLYYGEDSLVGLKRLPTRSVHCVVTSPPYWGLRDYGTGSAQIGLEKTPDEYVARLVEIFRELRRVLRDDGTLWLNLGDCFMSKAPGTVEADGLARKKYRPEQPEGLKPKDLVGIPWWVAFALRADGWYLRSEIIWAKSISGEHQTGTCMPESVKDRVTRSHEHLFLFSKSASYFYDRRAILEPHTMRPQRRPAGHKRRKFGDLLPDQTLSGQARDEPLVDGDPAGRNRRSVWQINPMPYPGTHFATFPPTLVLPCILAGTSAFGCCSACGAPWVRDENDVWDPSCDCPERTVAKSTVLDPFSGSGTTGHVALRQRRNYIGLDIGSEYLELARRRILEEDPLASVMETEEDGILEYFR